MPWIDVPDPTAQVKRRKLCRYDPQRRLLEFLVKGTPVVIDLDRIEEEHKAQWTNKSRQPGT